MNSCICRYELAPATMPRIVYSNTVARSKRFPSARRRSGIERKASNSDGDIRQPPIRVVADRFRHFRSRESPSALKVHRTEQPWVEEPPSQKNSQTTIVQKNTSPNNRS